MTIAATTLIDLTIHFFDFSSIISSFPNLLKNGLVEWRISAFFAR